jgi:hypothetical protein
MFETIRKIWGNFTRPIPNKHELKNHKKMPKNIYGSKTFAHHRKRFTLIHGVFKYKFIVPLLMLCEKILGKYLERNVPRGGHNTNIRIFDKAVNQAIEKWVLYYQRNTG